MSDLLWKIQNNDNDKPEDQKLCAVLLEENKLLSQGLISMTLIIIIVMSFWSAISFCSLGIVVRIFNISGMILKFFLTTSLWGLQEKEDRAF